MQTELGSGVDFYVNKAIGSAMESPGVEAIGAELVEVRWHGRGGQGAVTGAKILARAATKEGLWIQAFSEFGPERRGAPVLAFNRIGANEIRTYAPVEEPDVVVVIDPALLERAVLRGLKAEGWLVVNTPFSPRQVARNVSFSGTVATLDAAAVSREASLPPLANIPMLGALAAATGLIQRSALEEAVFETFRASLGEETARKNVRAVNLAWSQVRIGHYLDPGSTEEENECALPSWQELEPGGTLYQPGSARDYLTGMWRSSYPLFKREECNDCLRCWVFCPDTSIMTNEGKVTGIDLQYCKGCGVCAAVCPRDALKMVPEN
ncbi:MAG: 2-oxoacid:acceptor oxidoreductase family protein [Acidobacteria bacterium]|nr:2-oxoacid:acceptor oxidoreductase family protein [Acidobacteriota bacterium]